MTMIFASVGPLFLKNFNIFPIYIFTKWMGIVKIEIIRRNHEEEYKRKKQTIYQSFLDY